MNMKKILACALLGFTSVTLVACGGNEDDTNKDPGTSETEGIKVTFTFPENNTYKLYDSVNLKTGVVAKAENGDTYSSYTVSCEIEGIVEGNTLNTDNAGTFDIIYTYTNKGTVSTATRTVTVEANGTIGENLLPAVYQNNYTSLEGWGLYDSAAKFKTENGNIVVDATTSGEVYTTRLDTNPNPITLVEGQTYQILIKAKASQARDIQLQVGNMFDGSPYWAAAADPLIISLTSSMSTKAAYFTASAKDADLSKICMTIEMGNVGSFVSSTIEIESISLHTFEGEIKDETAPTITQKASSIIVDESSTNKIDKDGILEYFTFADNQTAADDLTTVVERIVSPSKTAVDEIDTAEKGSWTVTLSATDAAGNKTTATFTLVVRTENPALENYFNNIGNVSTWTGESNNGYISVAESSTIDNITMDYAVYYEWYDPQFWIETDYIDIAGTYTVTMTLKNSTDRNITVGGTIDGVGITATVVELTADTEQEVTFDITVTSGQKFNLQVLFDVYKDGNNNVATQITPADVFEKLTIKDLTLIAKK